MNTGDRSSTLIREDNRNTLTDLPGSRPAKVVGPTEESKDFGGEHEVCSSSGLIRRVLTRF